LVQGGVKNPSKVAPNKARGYVIVLGEFGHDADLAPVAKAVLGARTPHRSQAPPGVALELAAKLDDTSAAAAKGALAGLKGVDAKRSTADPKRGIISVQLTGAANLTVKQVLSTLKNSGIDARIVAGSEAVEEKKPKSK
jgi:hypothetical protein